MRFEPGIFQIQGYSANITPACSVPSALSKTHTPVTIAITFSLQAHITKGAQIPDTRSCRRLIFLWQRLIFVGPQ